MKICIVEDCKRKQHAKNWCCIHYNRWYIHGDPLFTLRSVRRPYMTNEQLLTWILSEPQSKEFGKILNGKAVVGNCREWQRGSKKLQIRMQNKIVLVHVAVWYLKHGKWSVNNLVRTCNNAVCVNPDHLKESDRKKSIRRNKKV